MIIDREMKALLYPELLKRDDLMFKINHPNSKPQETEIVNSME
jgi:ribosomal protein S24E